MSNLISAQISDGDLQEVLQAIATIQQKLPYCRRSEPAIYRKGKT